MKLCKDCKHVRFNGVVPGEPYCEARATKTPDYVNGGYQIGKMPLCQGERQSGYCGADGKLWEPKA